MIISSLEPFTEMSIDFLKQICQEEGDFLHLTYDSFVALSQDTVTDTMAQNFTNALKISKAELKAQICYDLCQFYLHDKEYALARENIVECRKNLELLKTKNKRLVPKDTANQPELVFCTISEEELNGCLMACGVFDEIELSLLHQMNVSMLNQYEEIKEIFKKDNVQNEIPLVNRKIVELEMDSAHSLNKLKLSKEVVVQVAALNVIASLISETDLFAYSQLDYLQKYQKFNGFTILVEAASEFQISSKNVSHRNKLRAFFKQTLCTMGEEPKTSDVERLIEGGLFTEEEINQLKEVKKVHIGSGENIELPQICMISDWKTSDSKSLYFFFYFLVIILFV